MNIYLVQTATDLEGINGYGYGLLQAGHPQLLVTFAEYAGRQTTIFRTTPTKADKGRQQRHLDAGKSETP